MSVSRTLWPMGRDRRSLGRAGRGFRTRVRRRGLNLLLIARRQAPWTPWPSICAPPQSIEVRPGRGSGPAGSARRLSKTSAPNSTSACWSTTPPFPTIGPFLDHPVEEHLRVIDVNCRGPLCSRISSARHDGAERGGIVLMTSTAGSQGGPWISRTQRPRRSTCLGRRAVGRACRKRRARRRVSRGCHAHAWIRSLEAAAKQGSLARSESRRRKNPRRPRPRTQRGPGRVLPFFGLGHGSLSAAPDLDSDHGPRHAQACMASRKASRKDSPMRVVISKPSGQTFVAAAYVLAFLVALAVGRAAANAQPIWIAAVADLAATLVVFACSVALDNSSVYDPYWSVAPLPIGIYWTLASGHRPRFETDRHPRTAGHLGGATYGQLGPTLARPHRRGFSLRRNSRQGRQGLLAGQPGLDPPLADSLGLLGFGPHLPGPHSAWVCPSRRRRRDHRWPGHRHRDGRRPSAAPLPSLAAQQGWNPRQGALVALSPPQLLGGNPILVGSLSLRGGSQSRLGSGPSWAPFPSPCSSYSSACLGWIVACSPATRPGLST